MATGIRVHIGSDITFLEAQEGKQAKAYARLAQAQYEVTGEGADRKFVELDSRWYDGEFTGAEAYRLRDQHQKGDALVVLGSIKEETREWEGRSILSERFYVNAFGPDAARYDGYELQRKERAAAPTQTQQSGPSREHQAASMSPDEAEAELHTRLNQLVVSERVSPADATAVMEAFKNVKDQPARVSHAAVSAAANMHLLRQSDLQYVSNVTDSYSSGAALRSWAEIEQQAPAASAPVQQQAFVPAM